MPDREFEVRQLAMADRHIERAEQIIADQELRLQLKGYDVELLERTLEVLKDSLRTMYEHRDIITGIIQDIDLGRV